MRNISVHLLAGNDSWKRNDLILISLFAILFEKRRTLAVDTANVGTPKLSNWKLSNGKVLGSFKEVQSPQKEVEAWRNCLYFQNM